MSNWRKSILKADDTMAEAVKSLNRESLRIVLVVDASGKLEGTVTDGDVRRALLRSCEMDTPIKEIMSRTPMVGTQGEEKKKLLMRMKSKDLLHIPLLDDNGRLVGMETLQHLTDKPVYENVVFLMAGGFGTRLRPLTLDIPKPLLKVGQKPILETILEQFIDLGFHNFCISTHYKAEMVRDHFGNGDKWDVNIQYVYEDTPKGTAGALGLMPHDITDLPIIVMNCDLLTKLNFKHLLRFHSEQGGIATMCVREYAFEVPYGVVETDGSQIIGIVEKPIHKFFVNAGIYVLNAELVQRVKGFDHIDMPNLLDQCMKQGETVNMFPVHEYWLDIGNLPDYRKANNDARGFAKEPGA